MRSQTAPAPYRPFGVTQAMLSMKKFGGGGGGDDGDERRERKEHKSFHPYNDGSRARRSSTKKKTEDTNTRALAGEEPTVRLRRGSATYRNVDLFAMHGVAPDQVLRQAIARKKIWDGFRASVSWSSGFASQFWTDAKDATNGWICAHQFDSCRQNAYAHSHAELEIGHKLGFYDQIAANADTIRVCDGSKHWDVMLFADVVAANEEERNLEPQCKTCNRDPRQKSKDDQGAGKYKPEEAEACPGGACGVTKISSL